MMLKSTTVLPTDNTALLSKNEFAFPQSAPSFFKARGPPKAVFTRAETAIYTGLSESFLEKDQGRRGPPCIYLTSKRVGYRKQDIDAWLESRPTTSIEEE